ncbi:MAG TPA: protein kinase [Myxococcota bacterium]
MGESPAGPEVINGRYRLDVEIGCGGMGRVWRGVDLLLKRPIAVKRILDDTDDPRTRFNREARISAVLNHPHIVTVYDYGIDETPFLVMELLQGCSLRERIARGAVDPHEALCIIHEIASALAFAHDNNYAHRDLKPANVMLTEPAGFAKVLDFGLAIDIAAVSSSRSRLHGTVAYLSREQIDGERGDTRSDMHALGIVWREMVLARNEFDVGVGTEFATQDRIRAHVLPPVSSQLPEVDAEVSELIQRLLSKDAKSRPTAVDVVERLQRLRGDAPQQPPTKPIPQPVFTPKRGQLVRVVLSALIVVAMIALVATLLQSAPTALPPTPERTPAKSAFVAIDAEARPPEDTALVALGRELFLDPSLSSTGSISCETCHTLTSNDASGTTAEPQTLRGANGTRPDANTPSIRNVALGFAMGTRADADLSEIITRAVTKPWLMGVSKRDDFVQKVASHPAYNSAFTALHRSVDWPNIVAAYGAYFEHLTPTPVAFDQVFRGGDVEQLIFSTAEKDGYAAFRDNGCVACHQGRGLGGNTMARLGAMVADPYIDRGQCGDALHYYCRSDADCESSHSTCDKSDPKPKLTATDHGFGWKEGAAVETFLFRVPSLRNVGVTGPYFHDGSARTLEEAIRVMGHLQLNKTLAERDVINIAAFLRALTAELPRDERDAIARVRGAGK